MKNKNAVIYAIAAADTLAQHHTHEHTHTFTHTHDGSTHTHTVKHSHGHDHYISADRHGHHHSSAELEELLKAHTVTSFILCSGDTACQIPSIPASNFCIVIASLPLMPATPSQSAFSSAGPISGYFV